MNGWDRSGGEGVCMCLVCAGGSRCAMWTERRDTYGPQNAVVRTILSRLGVQFGGVVVVACGELSRVCFVGGFVRLVRLQKRDF